MFVAGCKNNKGAGVILRRLYCYRIGLLASHILHVDVGTESHVVGEIPAFVVGVVVDDDVVAVPEPVIGVGQVKRGNAEVEAVKPKTVGAASGKVPAVAGAEAAGEAAVLEGMIDVEASIISSGIVTHPLTVVMDVRCFGMACAVAVGSPGRGLARRAARRSGTVRRNVTAAYAMAAALMIIVLREGGK